jgi:hypothetical protein
MNAKFLPGLPRLSQSAPHWEDNQLTDLINLWQDIKAVLDSMRRSTGVTSAIPTGTVIQHGMGFTPTAILLTKQDAGPTDVFPSALTATSFTINFSGGGSHVFGWSAEV